MNMELEEKTKQELSRLVGYACDGVLSEEQRMRMNELLAHSSAVRWHYLRYIAIHSALTTTAGIQAIRGVDELRDRLAVVDNSFATDKRERREWLSPALVRAAMILLLLVPPAYFVAKLIAPTGKPGKTHPVQQVPLTQSAGSRVAESTTTASPLADQGQARVSRVTAETRWSNPNESYTIDSRIRSGSRLRFLEGEIELVYETGVRLLLIGPVDFMLSDRGGSLQRGGLMASVPRAGHGFTIETPNGKVVDLGTEFGVMVDDFGVSEVSVFEGNVEAFPASASSPHDGKIQLRKGSALQWNNEMVKSLEADPRRLPISLASYSKLNIDQRMNDLSTSEAFLNGSIDSKTWTALGNIESFEKGLMLAGDISLSEVPYLVSKDQYDPTLGPVTVICDIRFPKLMPDDVPSFSILTRSESERSSIDRPWRDVLSTCVRCNLRSAKDDLDGLLETSTKYEPDRELTSLSWRGFRRPQQGVPYRVVMRDDGVNVSFTVTQLDKPSVTKTVVCRSLFQGYENHVALEGWDRGDVIVDKLQIYQEKSDSRLADHLTRFGLVSNEDSLSAATVAENSLYERIPSAARLVLADHFENATLDEDQWSVLGDVTIEHDSVSLGQSSPGNHIDTFHPRPYLLTRRKFSPDKSPVFVLGRIEFDRNFLQGYGGSFAIMTRSDDKYGEGPEWAVSALSTGIRCNLWPAAPQADHNLEIHEKVSSTSLTFLEGSGLALNPRSRSYYFLMEDTGDRATITFQDINDPALGETIQHEISTNAPRQGFIGFESCWGSRVLLDDVHIYVMDPPQSKD